MSFFFEDENGAGPSRPRARKEEFYEPMVIEEEEEEGEWERREREERERQRSAQINSDMLFAFNEQARYDRESRQSRVEESVITFLNETTDDGGAMREEAIRQLGVQKERRSRHKARREAVRSNRVLVKEEEEEGDNADVADDVERDSGSLSASRIANADGMPDFRVVTVSPTNAQVGVLAHVDKALERSLALGASAQPDRLVSVEERVLISALAGGAVGYEKAVFIFSIVDAFRRGLADCALECDSNKLQDVVHALAEALVSCSSGMSVDELATRKAEWRALPARILRSGGAQPSAAVLARVRAMFEKTVLSVLNIDPTKSSPISLGPRIVDAVKHKQVSVYRASYIAATVASFGARVGHAYHKSDQHREYIEFHLANALVACRPNMAKETEDKLVQTFHEKVVNAKLLSEDIPSVMAAFMEAVADMRLYETVPLSELVHVGLVYKNHRRLDMLNRANAENLTPAVCFAAVCSNADAIDLIPEDRRTYEVCTMAVKGDWRKIARVPRRVADATLVYMALRKEPRLMVDAFRAEHGFVLDFEILEYVTEPALLRLVSNYPEHYLYIRNMFLRNNAALFAVINHIAVERDWRVIEHLSTAEKTQAICESAVLHSGHALGFIQGNRRTPRILQIAAQHGVSIIEDFMAGDERTQMVYLSAAKGNPACLDSIPKKFKTLSFYTEMVRDNEESIAYVPEIYMGEALNYNSPSMGRSIMLKDHKFVKSEWEDAVAESLRFEHLLSEQPGTAVSTWRELSTMTETQRANLSLFDKIAAVRQDWEALQYIPVQDKAFWLTCGLVVWNTLLHMPSMYKTLEVCRRCLQASGMALQFIPPSRRKMVYCLDAVRQNGMALEFVPYALRTPELCYEAVAQNEMAWEHVPHEYLGIQDLPELDEERDKFNAEIARDLVGKVPVSAVWRKWAQYAEVKSGSFALMQLVVDADWREMVGCCHPAARMLSMMRPDRYTRSEYLDVFRRQGEVKRYRDVLRGRPLSDPSFGDQHKTILVCLAAVERNHVNMAGVPQTVLDDPVFYKCLVDAHVQHCVFTVDIPTALKTRKLMYSMVLSLDYALGVVPMPMRDQFMCDHAVYVDPRNLLYTPDAFKSVELCCLAVEGDLIANEFVPDEVKESLVYKRRYNRIVNTLAAQQQTAPQQPARAAVVRRRSVDEDGRRPRGSEPAHKKPAVFNRQASEVMVARTLAAWNHLVPRSMEDGEETDDDDLPFGVDDSDTDTTMGRVVRGVGLLCI